MPLKVKPGFLGELRRCHFCKKRTPMYWIPPNFWKWFVPAKHRNRHICFQCLFQWQYKTENTPDAGDYEASQTTNPQPRHLTEG